MHLLHLQKKTSALAAVSLMATLAAGTASAQTTPICNAYSPAHGCVIRNFPSGPYAYPQLAWQQIGVLAATPTSTNRAVNGDQALLEGNRAAVTMGLPANQVGNVATLLSESAPLVFARYNSMTNELRIEVYRAEQVGNVKVVQRAMYTPAHGRALAANLIYASDSEKQMRSGPSFNPFELFGSPVDDTFHQVDGLNAVQVAVGHAMRTAGASVGIVAMANLRETQRTETSGNIFRKTVTTYTDSFVKPIWYIVTPIAMQPKADSAFMCADNVVDPTTCTRVIPSGVVWKPWSGGNLPEFETQLPTQSQSKSGYTLLTFALLGFPHAIDAMMKSSIGLGGPKANDVVTLGNAMNPVLPLTGAGSGFGNPIAPSDAIQSAIMADLHNTFDVPSTEANGIKAVAQGGFGTCASGTPAAGCAGATGAVPRADSATQYDPTKFWHDGNGLPVRLHDVLTD